MKLSSPYTDFSMYLASMKKENSGLKKKFTLFMAAARESGNARFVLRFWI